MKRPASTRAPGHFTSVTPSTRDGRSCRNITFIPPAHLKDESRNKKATILGLGFLSRGYFGTVARLCFGDGRRRRLNPDMVVSAKLWASLGLACPENVAAAGRHADLPYQMAKARTW